MFEVAWTTEGDKWTPTGPVFDRAGNVYFSPLWPAEPVVLVSLDPQTGTRRWAVPGSAPSAGSPMVLDDPERPGEQIVYLGLYEEAMAVRTDGTIVWRMPSGLIAPPLDTATRTGDFAAFGVNYHPDADALVVDTGDGHLYAVDRSPRRSTPSCVR